MSIDRGLELAYRFLERVDEYDEWQDGDPTWVAATRTGRDEAITLLAGHLGQSADGHFEWPRLAALIGRLRYLRYLDPWPGAPEPDRLDLDAARDLLLAAARLDPDQDEVYQLTLVLNDQLDLDSRPADLDEFITWSSLLLEGPPGDPPEEEETDLRHALACAFFDRAESGTASRMADLEAAIEHLDIVLIAASPEQRTIVLTSLVHACWLRLDGDASDYELVDRMVGYGTRLWPLLGPDDDEREACGFYLACGIQEQMIRPSARYDAASVELAVHVLTELTARLAGSPQTDMYLVAEAGLGLFLVSRGEHAGSAADLSAAAVHVLRAARSLPIDDPEWSGVTQTVAANMATLVNFGLLTGPEHIDLAIGLLRAALANPAADPERVAMTRAALGTTLATRGAGRRGRDIADGISELIAAHDTAPTGSKVRAMIGWNLGSMLLTRYFQSRNRQDAQAARFYLAMVDDELAKRPDALSDLMADSGAITTAVRGLAAATAGLDGDVTAFSEAADCLRQALAALPSGHPLRPRMRGDLGLVLALSATQGHGNADEIREARRELDAAAAELPSGSVGHDLARLRTGAALAAVGLMSADVRAAREGVAYLTDLYDQLDSGTLAHERLAAEIGMLYDGLYGLTSRTVDLDAARSWLDRACARFERHPGDPWHAQTLVWLARLRRIAEVGQAGGSAEDRAADDRATDDRATDDGATKDGAARTGLAALRVRVRDVLLQTGTVNALATARAAAADAAEIASWCLDDKDPALAVEAVELGRGLVLHAATSVGTLPDLLAEAGYDALADEWRAEATDETPTGPWADGSPTAGYDGDGLQGYAFLLADGALIAPSDLRERTLAALAGPMEERLLTASAPARIAAALTRVGADALVYLLPAAAGRPIRTVLIPADGTGPTEVAMPRVPAAPLTEYLSAHADLLADDGQGMAIQRWAPALEELCSWAWPAVVAPLLAALSRELSRELPRLVLVPAGHLSLVPWHAARFPDGAGGWRYACAEAVFSYAASGRQFAEVSHRAVLPAQSRPVIVADPTGHLAGAILEARAIRECFYPDARYLGAASHQAATAGPGALGRGEPAEVLATMPSATEPGASVLHLAVHADVGSGGQESSFLHLADGQPLTLDRILRQAVRRPPGAAGGLVGLVACRSDLAATDYDEALTLATAFLAAGAATVVGARWEIRDEYAAVLMYMFHHFLRRADLAPADALRRAQLWMLDPRRRVPEEMPPELRAKVSSRLDQVLYWAGFTHQGR
jgi:hypothetical protein